VEEHEKKQEGGGISLADLTTAASDGTAAGRGEAADLNGDGHIDEFEARAEAEAAAATRRWQAGQDFSRQLHKVLSRLLAIAPTQTEAARLAKAEAAPAKYGQADAHADEARQLKVAARLNHTVRSGSPLASRAVTREWSWGHMTTMKSRVLREPGADLIRRVDCLGRQYAFTDVVAAKRSAVRRRPKSAGGIGGSTLAAGALAPTLPANFRRNFPLLTASLIGGAARRRGAPPRPRSSAGRLEAPDKLEALDKPKAMSQSMASAMMGIRKASAAAP
jgi:hypothetical protein